MLCLFLLFFFLSALSITCLNPSYPFALYPTPSTIDLNPRKGWQIHFAPSPWIAATRTMALLNLELTLCFIMLEIL